MIVTKNAAELCVLLIGELYGQLPSRLFAVLLAKGRSTIKHLAQNTSMGPRMVRHGLVVLTQQNLIYHYTDPDTSITHFEANSEAAYNIVRHGKILNIIHRNYGEDSARLVHQVLNLGHVKISDLAKQYKTARQEPGTANGAANGISSDTADNDSDYEGEALDMVAQLIAVGILEPVNARTFQSPEDVRAGIEKDIMESYPSGVRGAKQKADFFQKSAEAWKEYQDESRELKRQLEGHYLFGPGAKRRKLANGSKTNGFKATNTHMLDEEKREVAVRVNYDKCLVELRNHRLTRYVADEIGEVTAQVYEAALSALAKNVNICQASEKSNEDTFVTRSVTTMEIFENLRPGLDVSSGIGKAPPTKINAKSAERIQANQPGHDAEGEGEDMSEDDDDDDDDDDIEMSNGVQSNGVHETETKITSGHNGSRETKVKFEENVPVAPTKADRLQQMRQHLLLLAESNRRFIRHCGMRDQGEWTVDFDSLMRTLKYSEIDTLIEQTFGKPGLRLTRILRAKGKLDDKTLPALALMKKADVHVKMVEMELAGFLEVQEVPRDNNRTASRTLFLWFFEEEKLLTRVTDNTYKSMVRHLQRLEVERRRKKNVLAVVERKDVQGMEEEKLRGDVYNEYREFLDIESKLLGQVDRLDDLVSVFQNY
ncbi:RNA polymerase III subunit RPC82-domain-containing protein [Pseudomassariella vexata]|uniref:DNA-directed RNA polymerase III subunit RPC3 n=1 Tax=Pseudomassariella vexata TaxID=1141098 RepID=A0A1Y2DXE0_9PEZI|nr:RNA polymerase III subunit RPC82-domain-containing protein [Pseudomassariella vexata]ORY63960.1 RNA polymerase III subunit RPC82-domain-containing protein [Pseudomassariella vexata]